MDRFKFCSRSFSPRHPNNTAGTSRRIMLMGGSSICLVSEIALAAAEEADVVLLMDPDYIQHSELFWHCLTRLLSSEVKIWWKNITNHSQVDRAVASNFTDLVFITPRLSIESSSEISLNAVRTKLDHLITLLEAVRKFSPNTNFMLISNFSTAWRPGSNNKSPEKFDIWSYAFCHTVALYQRLEGLRVQLLLLGEVCHFGQSGESFHLCWHMSDVVELVLQVLFKDSDCSITNALSLSPNCTVTSVSFSNFDPQIHRFTMNSCISKERIAKNVTTKKEVPSRIYSVDANGDYIFTTYLTGSVDPQRNQALRPDQFQYLREWYRSVLQLNLRAVIFYDVLSTQFIQRIIHNTERVQFVKIKSLSGRTTNDARYYEYLHYLQLHPEIRRVFLTDISDVTFQRNPFELMSALGTHGDMLYVGTDIDFFPTLQSQPWIYECLVKCFGEWQVQFGRVKEISQMQTVYNAGVIGGTRTILLSALIRITQVLNGTPSEYNCNMPAVNYAIHRWFTDVVFTGFPLTSRFLQFQASPKGVYIIHK